MKRPLAACLLLSALGCWIWLHRDAPAPVPTVSPHLTQQTNTHLRPRLAPGVTNRPAQQPTIVDVVPDAWVPGDPVSLAVYEKVWKGEYERLVEHLVPELEIWAQYCQRYGVPPDRLYSTVRRIHVATTEIGQFKNDVERRAETLRERMKDLRQKQAAGSETPQSIALWTREYQSSFRADSQLFEGLATEIEARFHREIEQLTGIVDPEFFASVLAIRPKNIAGSVDASAYTDAARQP